MQIDGLTLMRDVYQNLIGEHIVVYTLGPTSLGGKLVEFNGGLLHLTTDTIYFGIRNIYIPVSQVVGVCGDK